MAFGFNPQIDQVRRNAIGGYSDFFSSQNFVPLERAMHQSGLSSASGSHYSVQGSVNIPGKVIMAAPYPGESAVIVKRVRVQFFSTTDAWAPGNFMGVSPLTNGLRLTLYDGENPQIDFFQQGIASSGANFPRTNYALQACFDSVLKTNDAALNFTNQLIGYVDFALYRCPIYVPLGKSLRLWIGASDTLTTAEEIRGFYSGIKENVS